MDERKQGLTAEESAQAKKKSNAIGCWIILGVVVLVAMCASPGDDEGGAAKLAEGAPAAGKKLSEAEQADVAQWYLSLTTRSSGCDSRLGEVGAALTALGEGKGDAFSGYAKAREAHASCEQAWLSYDQIETPDALDDFENQVDKARQDCKTAAFSKRAAAEKAMALFDGDMRPSNVTGMSEDLGDAKMLMASCFAEGSGAAEAAGANLEELLKTDGSTE